MQNISFLYCFVSRKTTQPSILSRFHSFKSLQWCFVCKIGQIITFTAMDCSRKLAFESNWLLATDNSASIFSWQSIFTLSLWNWVAVTERFPYSIFEKIMNFHNFRFKNFQYFFRKLISKTFVMTISLCLWQNVFE